MTSKRTTEPPGWISDTLVDYAPNITRLINLTASTYPRAEMHKRKKGKREGSNKNKARVGVTVYPTPPKVLMRIHLLANIRVEWWSIKHNGGIKVWRLLQLNHLWSVIVRKKVKRMT